MGVVVDQRKVFIHEQMAKVTDHECFSGMKKIWSSFVASGAKKQYSIKKVSADVRKEVGNVPSGQRMQLYTAGEQLLDLSVILKL